MADSTLTPGTKAIPTSNERLSQIREHDFPILLEFHSKHALGPLTRPSCLVCGKVPEQWPPAIQHAELPGIVVCHPCRDRATHETLAPSSNGNNALPVGAEDDPLLVWVLERYENCIRLAAQKKGQDRDGWLEDATHFQAVLKRLAAHGNETGVLLINEADPLPKLIHARATIEMLISRHSQKAEVCHHLPGQAEWCDICKKQHEGAVRALSEGV